MECIVSQEEPEHKKESKVIKTMEHGDVCWRWCGEKCRTCDELEKHEAIYGGLDNKQQLLLFKERTKLAFGGDKDGN